MASGSGSARQRQPVGEDQTALGVGVEHLDGAPLRMVSTSPGLVARTPGMFSVVGAMAVTRTRTPSSPQAPHRGQDGGGPAHVGLHGDHAVGRLEGQPPESKVMPLPTRTTWGTAVHRHRVGGLVGDLDQPGRLDRPPGHPQQPAQPLDGDPLLVPDLDAHASPPVGLLLGRLGQARRGSTSSGGSLTGRGPNTRRRRRRRPGAPSASSPASRPAPPTTNRSTHRPRPRTCA